MAEMGTGRIIDNKYEILTSIGRGGMSYVWLCRDKRLNKMWAVKEFRPSSISSQSAANRQGILDEANFIKRLDHPAIPRVVDIIDTGASIFVVMDFIDGTALSKALRQQGEPFEQERVIEWGIQLCDVLQYLHDGPPPDGYPVIYRDMKPANIMLRGDDTVKLIDFGISMELMPSGPSDVRVIGTAGYGAPEQVDREIHKTVPVDARADIYALGTTLYSLVTGHVPRMHKDETGKQSTDFEMRPIREWDGQLSEGLEHIIQKATQRDPLDRYQNAADMRYDLEHYQELTQEYRAVQKKKVDGFRNRLIATGIAFVAGILCLGISFLVRNSSYGSLVHEASLADATESNIRLETDEKSGLIAMTADASPAEDLLTRAIEVSPDRIDTYFELLNVYEEDDIFTTTESKRWMSLWQRYGRDLEANPQYNKLCYNVGIMYLVYYDYANANAYAKYEQGGGADSHGVVSGQAAIENMTQAVRWFNDVVSHPEPVIADVPSGQDTSDSHDLYQIELDSATHYVSLGTFYNKVAKANREGGEILGSYKEFWSTLEQMLIGTDEHPPTIRTATSIVKLKMCQVAFESINSSTYLTGFRNAGVTKEQTSKLLDAVVAYAQELQDFARLSDAAGPMYDEIDGGKDDARTNIARVYDDRWEQVKKQASKDDEGKKAVGE
ncbi:MAG: serine/threonine protein kinase [Atopobiaceae bacterium]|nr:serine/threonine protein kinase [Atopobiaceae bacterium]